MLCAKIDFVREIEFPPGVAQKSEKLFLSVNSHLDVSNNHPNATIETWGIELMGVAGEGAGRWSQLKRVPEATVRKRLGDKVRGTAGRTGHV